MSETVYKYNAKKNPSERSISGVPLRDLTAADLAAWPDHIIRSIEACNFYEAPKSEPKKSRAKNEPEIINQEHDFDHADSAGGEPEAEGGK